MRHGLEARSPRGNSSTSPYGITRVICKYLQKPAKWASQASGPGGRCFESTRIDQFLQCPLSHGAGVASGLPFSTTYTPTSRNVSVPVLWASCLVPPGMMKPSPGLIFNAGFPSMRISPSPAST